MKFWIFGLMWLLVLSKWTSLSVADEQEDDDDDDEQDDVEEKDDNYSTSSTFLVSSRTIQISPSQAQTFSGGVHNGKVSTSKPSYRSFSTDDDEEDEKEFTRAPSTFHTTNSPVVYTVGHDESDDDSPGSGSAYFTFSSSISLSPSLSTLTNFPSSHVLPTPSTLRQSLQYNLQSTPTNPSGDSTLKYSVSKLSSPSFSSPVAPTPSHSRIEDDVDDVYDECNDEEESDSSRDAGEDQDDDVQNKDEGESDSDTTRKDGGKNAQISSKKRNKSCQTQTKIKTLSVPKTASHSSSSSSITRTPSPSPSTQPNATSCNISSSTSSPVSTAVPVATGRPKPDTNGTGMITTIIAPSTFVYTSGSDPSITVSPTPSLSSSMVIVSTRSATPALYSSSVLYPDVNSTVISSSFNVILNKSSSVTPTMTSTVLASSSILHEEKKLHCGASKTGQRFEKGVLIWKKTLEGTRANESCPYSKTEVAYRWCRFNTTTKTHYWDDVHDENCSVLEKDRPLDELIKEDVTSDNEEMLAVLLDYITSSSNATLDLVKSGADFMAKLVEEAQNLSNIRDELLSSISNVMNADSTVLAEANKEHNSTTKILKYIGKLMDSMSLSGQKVVRENLTNLVAEAWDVANITKDLSFDSSSQGGSEVSVKLPSSLIRRFKGTQRITFVSFSNDKLFPQADRTKKFINSKIVSASIKGHEVKNLSDRVVIEFKITNKSYANNCSCVFWDFEADGGFGRWSSNGCDYETIGDGRARCSCNHLTHFGILVDLSPDDEIGDTDRLVLEAITFIGCYLSLAGLVLTIITLLSFKKYRNGVSGQILLNLCLALIFSLVVFLAGIEQVDNEGTCVTMAALLQYFVLVAVFWMGLEAFHMFINIVLDRLSGELGKTFVLKCAAVAWVLPMIIVVIPVLVSTDDYKNDRYCRVTGISFYIAFLVPTVTVLVFNVIVFLIVVKALFNTRVTNNRQKQGIVHFRRVLGIAVVFGITWLFGVLAIGELKLIFQYLFCVTNAFQGFMIFVLYCLTDRKVRERLVRFLCALPDPNKNRIIESTSTQRPTDIDIDLSMFQERDPSFSRPRNWSGTWPMPGHSNLARVTPKVMDDPVIVYPPHPTRSYNLRASESRGYIPDSFVLSYEQNLPGQSYHSQPTGPGYDSNTVWEYELETFPLPYNRRNPPGSQPVTNVLHEEGITGDKLVDSTMSQLERSGGEVSLQSQNSVLFFDNGRRVEVPKHPELSGSNNNWENPRVDGFRDSRTFEPSFEGPRRYSQGGDGLSFYKKPRKKRLMSATTTDELNKRFVKPKSLGNRGVHFPKEQQMNSPTKESTRWSQMHYLPRLKTRSREGDIPENDERDGTRMTRVEHEPHGMTSAQPSTRVIDNGDLEEEYLKNGGGDLDHEEQEISSNFIAVSSSKNSKELKESVRPPMETQVRAMSDPKLYRGSESNGSETSSDASMRWSEVGHTPDLKSYSQTTISDFNSEYDPKEGKYFTEF